MCYNTQVIVCIHQKGGYMKNLMAFPMADDGQSAPIFGLMARRIAFTMAEILLSLTIIGVVAAITLPSLTGNINERTWNTQRKALYARISQAIALMPALNGFGTGEITIDEITNDDFAINFVTAGLSKVLKINNICENENLKDCGLPSKLTRMYDGTTLDWPLKLWDLQEADGSRELFGTLTPNTKAAAIETQNGESIAIYYNPKCVSKGMSEETSDYRYWDNDMCANLVYDLNGNKGPNTVGKDIGFITVFYSVDSLVVAPMPLPKNTSPSEVTLNEALNLCKTNDIDARLPNEQEMASLAINKAIIGFENTNMYWISTKKFINNNLKETMISLGEATTWYYGEGSTAYARCIKR